MKYTLKNDYYNVEFEIANNSTCIVGGSFGEMSLIKSTLMTAVLKNVMTGEEFTVSSEDFEKVKAHCYSHSLKVYLSEPNGLKDIVIVITGETEEYGIVWSVDVINDNSGISVMDVSYPLPVICSDHFDMFVPGACGKVIKDAEKKGFDFSGIYPMHQMCMQYFAVYGKNNGVYLGIEDPRGSMKMLGARSKDGIAQITASFYAVNSNCAHNSFSVYGKARWQYFKGDWYDATMIYADFVYKNAEWLPLIGENGREDTAQKYKDIPFWVCDYIPNSEYQGANRPMMLSAGSDHYEPDYWYNAVIELQKELGVPIAYHVYNWHKIPFNIEYPHFLPAKEEFAVGLKELKKHDILVMPYINGVSWETRDGELGHEINFGNTGYRGAVIDRNGGIFTFEYPQTTVSGHKAKLAPMCPTYEGWHKTLETLIRDIEQDFDVDGIYIDEISAHPARECHNKEHQHLPGGGSYWVENYNLMMEKIRAYRPDESFYFSECNAEPYMKSFDGYLTWTWTHNGEVPAFPAIYSGYIQMLGRYSIGAKKEDYEYFKYVTARAVIYGQQLGWCKADVLYKPEWLKFLKRSVLLRYRDTELFNSARMLRPPYTESDLPDMVTESAHMWFEGEDIDMECVFAGAWKYRMRDKWVIFAVNIAEQTANFTMSFDINEYGLSDTALPYGFRVDGSDCRVSGTLAPCEYKVWEIESK